MIKYKLTCCKCKNSFDSWFASSKEYEKLKKLNHLNCIKCNSLKVEKSVMSPNILGKNNNDELKSDEKISDIKKKIKDYQKFIKKNFDYVGENFSYEARSIHYENKSRKFKKKGIYGKATSKEVKELKEEGIETEYIPWLSEKEN